MNIYFFPKESVVLSSPVTPTSLLPEDGYVRMFLRGRPVTMHIPDDQKESYSLDHKVALPDRKLKLQWVYPSEEKAASVCKTVSLFSF